MMEKKTIPMWLFAGMLSAFLCVTMSSCSDSDESNPGTPAADTSTLTTFTVGSVSFNMVAVDGGTFRMGATYELLGDATDSEKPDHSVTLSSFRIGETEVTQELWQAVMGTNPSAHQGARLPVEQVSWVDCLDFISKLNALTGQTFRLPTEAEWEFAARGGTKRQDHKFSGSNKVNEVAWFQASSGGATHEVGTKLPNELGIYDMSGNVWEWCKDFYGAYSSESQTNPSGPAMGTFRVIRGGAYDTSFYGCRVSYRETGTDENHRSGSCGLRLAL